MKGFAKYLVGWFVTWWLFVFLDTPRGIQLQDRVMGWLFPEWLCARRDTKEPTRW